MDLLTPDLGLGRLEVGFVDHISNVAKGMILYHNIDAMYVSRIMNINGIRTHYTHKIT